MKSPFVVDTDWLFVRLDDPTVSIVDASWYLPTMGRNGRAEFDAMHIPGAVYFDIDAFSEPEAALPHTLASPEHFAREAGKLGISHTDTIVVYDGSGLFSAARAWWNFRIMGAAKVVILDGGLPEWIEHRLPVEAGTAPIYPKLFVPNFDAKAVIGFEEMGQTIEDGAAKVADARPAGRFSGVEPEPRAGMRSGHMPGAKNLPATTLSENGKLLNISDLRAKIDAAGINRDEEVITTCGSGVTAAIISLALESTGHSNHRLYDGSWSEWGGRDDTPIVTDQA
ncbi:3-mercaptopyruvate sulfurtransferase [Pseudahrensia aquimaris]|uniref:3-mercaptopyruvate sulfurtransferase n=1 Tax=Pseudahrensia aquimaris TaxID=744461 RepID=A0ABW3FHN5_9HYPH